MTGLTLELDEIVRRRVEARQEGDFGACRVWEELERRAREAGPEVSTERALGVLLKRSDVDAETAVEIAAYRNGLRRP